MLWLYDMVEYDTVIATDSCLIGAGGTCKNEYFHYKFDEETLANTDHIAQREILVICIVVKLWKNKLKGKLVRISKQLLQS